MTPIQVALLGFVLALLCGFVATACWPQAAARAQGRGGFPAGRPDRAASAGCSRNATSWRSSTRTEQTSEPRRAKAAREWLATQPMFGQEAGAARAWLRARLRDRLGREASRRMMKSCDRGALRSRDAAHDLPQFEEADWEQALADFKNTDVDIRRRHRRRQDVKMSACTSAECLRMMA